MSSRSGPRDQGDKKMTIPKDWTHVGIGAANNASTIHKTSVKQLRDKAGKFKPTGGSNTRLLGVGAINGENRITENSFDELKTIRADGIQKDVIIEFKDSPSETKKRGSNNTLFGIGAINGSNTIEKDSFKRLTTISTVEQRVVIKAPTEMDPLKEETESSNKRFGIGAINRNNTIKKDSFEQLKTINPDVIKKEKEETKDSNKCGQKDIYNTVGASSSKK